MGWILYLFSYRFLLVRRSDALWNEAGEDIISFACVFFLNLFLSLLLFYDDVSPVDSNLLPRFFLFDLDFASSLCPQLIYGWRVPYVNPLSDKVHYMPLPVALSLTFPPLFFSFFPPARTGLLLHVTHMRTSLPLHRLSTHAQKRTLSFLHHVTSLLFPGQSFLPTPRDWGPLPHETVISGA